MRASLYSFITHEKNRRDRINHIWRPLRGKVAILADYVNATDATRMIADADMILTGTNITSATAAVAVESGGNFYPVVVGNTNGATIGPATLTNGSPLTEFTWGTDQEVEVEWLVQMDAAASAETVKVGLSLTNNVDTAGDNDQVHFRMQNDFVTDLGTSIGGTDVAIAGVATFVASQYVHLAIKLNLNGNAHAFVDGREVECNGDFGGTVGAGNIVDLVPFYGALEATRGSEPKVNLVGFAISRALGA